MLAIRIGYGDVISEQMLFPLSSTNYETANRMVDEGRAAKQSVTILTAVSSVPPLSEIITGMDYGDEKIRKELDFLVPG